MLAEAVEFDEETANRNIQAVRPGMKVDKVSVKSGEGMNEYLEFLAGHRATRHSTSSAENNHRSVSIIRTHDNLRLAAFVFRANQVNLPLRQAMPTLDIE